MPNLKQGMNPIEKKDMPEQPGNPLSEALKRRRIAKANKRRLTNTNDRDDDPGDLEDPQTEDVEM